MAKDESPKKSSKDKDKNKKKKGKEKKRKVSKRVSKESAMGEPAYAPYLAMAEEVYKYFSVSIAGPKYDPYGPRPEEELAEYKQHLAKRGNCQLYITFFLILMIPVYVLGSTAFEKGAVCRADQEFCHKKCVTDLEAQLASSTSSAASQTAVSGGNELVVACREQCDGVYFECNRPTYLLYGGCGMLLFSCPALMCLTNIFDNVREATRKEAEKIRQEGLDKREREATAPKQRERYISKRNQQQGSKDAPDEEAPESPKSDTEKKRRTMSGTSSELTEEDDFEIPVDREDPRCVRVLKKVFKRCMGILWKLVSEPVYAAQRKWKKLTQSKKAPSPAEIFTDVECPRCNSTVTVQGLDRASTQESIFSKQWGLNRCAIYCPVCNEILSGICAF